MWERRITLFCCDWCGMEFEHMGDCHSHEQKCPENPANKTCLTCEYGWDSNPGEHSLSPRKQCAVLGTTEFTRHCDSWKGIEDVQ